MYLEDTDLYQGIRIGQEQVKLALFTDDVILFLGNALSYHPDVLHLISQFGTFSGYKINVTKSELLELAPPLTGQPLSQVGLHLQPVRFHLTFLGIKIGHTAESIYGLNYPSLINKIVLELKRFTQLPLSLYGRCHLVKMSA